jgi:hypothetical protein
MSSRLLQLPAELRESIYEYTLTEPKGLPWKTLFDTEGGPANSLKLVSRQLYTETNGLGFKYNAVTFHQANARDDIPSVQLRRFADGIAPRRLGQLRSMIASTIGDIPQNRTPLRQVAEYCRANPHITFKFVIKSWSYSKSRGLGSRSGSLNIAVIDVKEYYNNGSYIQEVIRGQRTLGERTEDDELWDAQEPLQTLQAPNLRFWPAETYIDDECWAALQHAINVGRIRHSYDEMLTLFETWANEGI